MTVVIKFSFFFNDTTSTQIYTLSLHDALPIFSSLHKSLRRKDPLVTTAVLLQSMVRIPSCPLMGKYHHLDLKSTRLNSSHANSSYPASCLRKKFSPIHHLST